MSKNGISTGEDKIKVILQLLRPINSKQVHGFMGHCGYYQRFIFRFANIAQPLYALFVIFEWTKECEVSFQKLTEALIHAPILRAPDWNKIFHVHVDASKFAIGCVLVQLGEHKMDFLGPMLVDN